MPADGTPFITVPAGEVPTYVSSMDAALLSKAAGGTGMTKTLLKHEVVQLGSFMVSPASFLQIHVLDMPDSGDPPTIYFEWDGQVIQTLNLSPGQKALGVNIPLCAYGKSVRIFTKEPDIFSQPEVLLKWDEYLSSGGWVAKNFLPKSDTAVGGGGGGGGGTFICGKLPDDMKLDFVGSLYGGVDGLEIKKDDKYSLNFTVKIAGGEAPACAECSQPLTQNGDSWSCECSS